MTSPYSSPYYKSSHLKALGPFLALHLTVERPLSIKVLAFEAPKSHRTLTVNEASIKKTLQFVPIKAPSYKKSTKKNKKLQKSQTVLKQKETPKKRQTALTHFLKKAKAVPRPGGPYSSPSLRSLGTHCNTCVEVCQEKIQRLERTSPNNKSQLIYQKIRNTIKTSQITHRKKKKNEGNKETKNTVKPKCTNKKTNHIFFPSRLGLPASLHLGLPPPRSHPPKAVVGTSWKNLRFLLVFMDLSGLDSVFLLVFHGV